MFIKILFIAILLCLFFVFIFFMLCKDKTFFEKPIKKNTSCRYKQIKNFKPYFIFCMATFSIFIFPSQYLIYFFIFIAGFAGSQNMLSKEKRTIYNRKNYIKKSTTESVFEKMENKVKELESEVDNWINISNKAAIEAEQEIEKELNALREQINKNKLK